MNESVGAWTRTPPRPVSYNSGNRGCRGAMYHGRVYREQLEPLQWLRAVAEAESAP